MATLTTAFNTTFTPAVGTFVVQCSGGIANLQRRGTSGAAWATAGQLKSGETVNIDNPIAGVEYQFVGQVGNPVVQADQ